MNHDLNSNWQDTYSSIIEAGTAKSTRRAYARDVIYFWAWAIGTALAGVGGVFLALDTRLIPTMGWDILVPIFVAVVMGGIGSVCGAVLGGLIVGLAMEIAAGFIPPTYKLAVAFLLMIVVLLFKPMGLFAERK